MTHATDRHRHRLAALGAAIPEHTIVGQASTPISGIACRADLADVEPGTLFAPLDLPVARAVAVSRRAAARGAAALLLEQAAPDLPIPQLVVADTRSALARVAAAFYHDPARSLRCIGVTGTAGKTTTTLLTHALLRAGGLRPGLIGTLEWRTGDTYARHQTDRTTPEAPVVHRLLRTMVDAGDDTAILEASSQGLAQHRLDGVPFAVGAMTHITRDHLDFHQSLDAYWRAKARLFDGLAAVGGTAVLNADDPAARLMAEHAGAARIVRFSASGQPVEVRATGVQLGPTGTRFTLWLPGYSSPVTLPLLGTFNVANALCAAAIAHVAGVLPAEIVAGLQTTPRTPGLLTPIDAGQPFDVLIDEAKSAVALVAALETARQRRPAGRLIAVVSGSDLAPPGVLAQCGEIAALAADFTVFTTRRARLVDPAALLAQLAAGAGAAGGQAGLTFACEVDRWAALTLALSQAGPGDCVLLTGKGIEDTLTVGNDVRPWDEAAAARQILAELGSGAEAAPEASDV